MRSKSLKQFIEEKRSTSLTESLGQYVNDVNTYILGAYGSAIKTIVKNFVSFMFEETYDRDRAVDVLYNLALKGTKAYNKANNGKYSELASDEDAIYKLAKKLLVKIEPMAKAEFKLKTKK